MLRTIFFLGILLSTACNSEPAEERTPADTPVAMIDTTNVPLEDPHIHGKDTVDVFSNARFKNVWVEKISDTSYQVTGKAQVFEAAYSWVVEDGHDELLSGHGMTDAGAPEFGNFSFVLNVKKKRENSKLHLVLFESSPKDGSRQHELPVPLP